MAQYRVVYRGGGIATRWTKVLGHWFDLGQRQILTDDTLIAAVKALRDQFEIEQA